MKYSAMTLEIMDCRCQIQNIFRHLYFGMWHPRRNTLRGHNCDGHLPVKIILQLLFIYQFQIFCSVGISVWPKGPSLKIPECPFNAHAHHVARSWEALTVSLTLACVEKWIWRWNLTTCQTIWLSFDLNWVQKHDKGSFYGRWRSDELFITNC